MLPGTKLNHYRITGQLGAGGMGEVYRAEDGKLRREVAIKVLPREVAGDPERLARFEREAQLLAALNHPNIAGIHGLEEADGTPFLVLELVEGETIEQRLARERPELRRTLEIGKQIAEALEAAHARGIVHRDLKPANVKVNPEGQVKVLDLGLAKALLGEPGAPGGDAQLTQSPTVFGAGTATGVILGTAAYMSPEQARGRSLDARTDIWSFGCLLFEMLAGRRPFAGETLSDTMASILKEEPDWQSLPGDVPASVRQLLARCLQKDARRRLQAIGDARIELEETLRQLDGGTSMTAAAVSGMSTSMPAVSASALPPAVARRSAAGVAAVVALTAAVAAAGAWWLKPAPVIERRATHVAIPLDGLAVDLTDAGIAISSDGRSVVVRATREGVEGDLWTWSMDGGRIAPVDGTRRSWLPQFSADGRWLLHGRGGELVRTPLSGGSNEVLVSGAETAPSTSFDIGVDGTLVYGDSRRGLNVLAPGSSVSERLIEPVAERNEMLLAWPELLPGGGGVLYTAVVSDAGSAQGRIMHLPAAAGSEPRTVLDNGSQPRVVGEYLLYQRGSAVWAAPFDRSAVAVAGPGVAVLDGVAYSPSSRAGQWDVSTDGTLVYLAGGSVDGSMELRRVEAGGAEQLVASGDVYEWPTLSPDGERLAVAIHGADQHGVWVYDLSRGTRVRLSFVGNDGHPVWSPDGTRVAFYSGTSNGGDLYWVAADGSEGEQATRLTSSELGRVPRSFSPDGKVLTFTEAGGATGEDIYLLDLESGTEQALMATSYQEGWPMISPAGRAMAYTSDESGQVEVYLRPFPEAGAKVAVSIDGGGSPAWSSDGSVLYFRRGQVLWAVDVTYGERLGVSTPRRVRDDLQGFYDPAPGGGLLLSRNVDVEQGGTTHVVVVLDWLQEVAARLAGDTSRQ